MSAAPSPANPDRAAPGWNRAARDGPPPVYPPPPPDLPQPNMPRRRMSTVRIVCGVLWASIAIVCAAGSVGEWLIGVHGGAILCLVIAVGSGWYDYRVWTSRSRRLIV